MATFTITTTGTMDPVRLDDLGIEPISHPVVDYDLIANHGLTLAEVTSSADLRYALSQGYITAKQNNVSVTDTDMDSAGHAHPQGVMDALQGSSGTPSATNRFVTEAEKGVTIATLDANGTVPLSQLPAGIQGGLTWKGLWDASTNTPTLASGVGTNGDMYRVSVAGTTILDGISDWQVGDHLIFIDDGTNKRWEKLDNTDSVTSVAGKVGAVSLVLNDMTDVDLTGAANGDLLGIVDVAGSLVTKPISGAANQLHVHNNKAVLDKITTPVITASGPPVSPSVGDIWVRSSDGEVFVYTGTEWLSAAIYEFVGARGGSFSSSYLRTTGNVFTNNSPFLCQEQMVLVYATLTRRNTVAWDLLIRKNYSTATELALSHPSSSPNEIVVGSINHLFNSGDKVHLYAKASVGGTKVKQPKVHLYFRKRVV